MGINTRHRRAKRQYNLPVVSPSSSSRIPTSTSTPTAATTQSTVGIAKPEAAGISCSYIGNTGVPDQLGGVVFSTLAAVLNCQSLPVPLLSSPLLSSLLLFPLSAPLLSISTILQRLTEIDTTGLVLLLALLSELPPPSSIVQRFWSYVLPSFGESAGVGGVGAAQIYVASVFLSHSVEGFPLVGAWMCMSMGVVNLLFVRPPTLPSLCSSLTLSHIVGISPLLLNQDIPISYPLRALQSSLLPLPIEISTRCLLRL